MTQGVTEGMVREIKEKIGPFRLVRVLSGYAIQRTDRFGVVIGGTVGNILQDGSIEWNENA